MSSRAACGSSLFLRASGRETKNRTLAWSGRAAAGAKTSDENMLCNPEAQPHNLISALFGTPGTLLCPMGLGGVGGCADDCAQWRH